MPIILYHGNRFMHQLYSLVQYAVIEDGANLGAEDMTKYLRCLRTSFDGLIVRVLDVQEHVLAG